MGILDRLRSFGRTPAVPSASARLSAALQAGPALPRPTAEDVRPHPIGERIITSGWGRGLLHDGIAALRLLPYADEHTAETAEIRSAYREMMKSGVVKAATFTQALAVACQDWQVHPAKADDPRDKDVADHCRWQLESLDDGFPATILNTVLHAAIDGYSLSERVFVLTEDGEYEGKHRLKRLRILDTADLRLEIDHFDNIKEIASTYDASLRYPVKDFFLFEYFKLFGGPQYMSAFRAAYAPYWVLDTVRKLRAIATEKFSTPFLKGTYSVDSQKSTLESALRAAKGSTWISVPEGVQIEVLNLAVGADAIFKSHEMDLKEDIQTAVNNAFLQSGTGQVPDGAGSSAVHKGTSELWPWFLGNQFCVRFSRDLFPDIITRNFAGVTRFPRLTLGGVTEEEMQKAADRITKAQQIGLKVSRKYAVKTLGIEEAADKDDELTPPSAMPPAGGDPLAGLGALPFDEAAKPVVVATQPTPATTEQHEHEFSSTQFDLPPDVAVKVLALGRTIPDIDLAADGREDDPHITIRYGLHGDDVAAVRRAVEDFGPVTVRLGRVSRFPAKPGKPFDVVKIDVHSDALRRLNQALAVLPHTDTHPLYHPHCTLAYVRPGLGAKYAGNAALDGTRITFDRLTFSDRDGRRITIRLSGTDNAVDWETLSDEEFAQFAATTWAPHKVERGPNKGRMAWKSSSGKISYEDPNAKGKGRAEEKAKAEAEAKAKREAEAKAREEAKAKAKVVGDKGDAAKSVGDRVAAMQADATQRTPEAVKSLAADLSKLTVEQIKGINKQYGAGVSGAKAALVQRLLDKVGPVSEVKPPAPAPPAAPPAVAPTSPPPPATPVAPAKPPVEKEVAKALVPPPRPDFTGVAYDRAGRPSYYVAGKPSGEEDVRKAEEQIASRIAATRTASFSAWEEYNRASVEYQDALNSHLDLIRATPKNPLKLPGHVYQGFKSDRAMNQKLKARDAAKIKAQSLTADRDAAEKEAFASRHLPPDFDVAASVRDDAPSQTVVKKLSEAHAEYERDEVSLASARDKRTAMMEALSNAKTWREKEPHYVALKAAADEVDRLQKKVNAHESVVRSILQSELKPTRPLSVEFTEVSAPNLLGGKRMDLDDMDRGAAKAGLAFVSSITEGQFIQRKIGAAKSQLGRAYYSDDGGGDMIAAGLPVTGEAGTATAVHELGHFLEKRKPGVQERVRAFLKYRLGDEKLVDMGSVPGGEKMKGEMVRKDNFDRALSTVAAYYVGKDYTRQDGSYGGSEVLSMGIEQLYRNPAQFAARDPEYAAFIIGLLRLK